MAQHDYNIANQTGANFRADLNNALSAISSNNSGSSEPSTMYAYEWWIDTSSNVLKLRNSSNNAWITMPFSITADNTIDINAGTVNGITSFSFSSGSTVTTILDEDNLGSDSATALATQQSIKAYVDSQVTAQDLDISDGSSTIAIDLDSETLSLLGGTGVTSAASGNGVTFAIGQSVGTSDNVVFNQVTGALVGNASTATALATARTISGVSFDGTANITLDTDDIGEGTNKYFTAERVDDQVNTLLTAGANISLTYDDAAGTLTIANTNSADITSVVAGDGLSGGGTSGDVTLAVGVDDSSIEINSDALRVKASGITNAMLAGSIANAKLANSSITVNSQAISLGGSHTFDTDDIGEGSSNLYYTDARANSAIDARVTNTFINNLSGVVADTATALATGRTIALSGDVTASGVSFDGTGNITLSTTIAANSVALGTDTTGNYVATIAGTTNEIDVSGSGSETATVTIGLPDDVTIAGNLTVNGTTTTVNSDTLAVTDPLIKLAKANSGADSLDIGFYGLYDTSGSQDLYAGLFRDANDSGKFKLFKDLQVEPTTTVNTSGTGYAVGTLVSSLEGNVTGNVTGTVSSISNHSTSDLSEGTNLYYTDARFDTRLGTKTTDNLTEGSSNLYMTTERVQDIVGGMVTGNTETGITVTYDDSDGTLDFVVGTLNQDTTGNAATATALETARTIGGTSFDGTGNIDLAGVNTTGNQDTSGNAATATALATGRTIGMTGDVVWTSASFDGSGNVTGTATIQANSVALGTDTTGDYVGTITGGTGITSTGATSGEGVAHSLSVDAAQTQITSVGALDGGSITSGFGSIDVGSSAITTSGTVTGGTLAGTLSTAAQTNITSVGTLTSFRSTGIDDNADALAITIDSSENVGIGTSSPTSKLHIDGAEDSTGGITLTAGAQAHNWYLASDFVNVHDIGTGSSSAAHTWHINGSEKVRIDASGNVGIGTSSPSFGSGSGLEIERAGIATIRLQNSNSKSVEITQDSDFTIASKNSGSNILLMPTSNVGIGTTSPSKSLHILNADPVIRLEDSSPSAYAEIDGAGGDLIISCDAGNDDADSVIQFKVDNSEKMRIDSSGNVAIAQTSTSNTYKLQVNGAMRLSGGSGYYYINTGADSGLWMESAHNLRFATSDSERMRIDSSGNVGIGTASPENNLHIFTNSGDEGLTIKSTGDTSNAIIIDANRGNAGAAINALTGKWNGTSVADILFLTGSDTTNKDDGVITFRTSSADNIAERMRITSSGKLAIGTTGLNNSFVSTGIDIEAGTSPAITMNRNSDGDIITFKKDNGTGTVGTISITSTSTAYNTSSDARLKDVTGKAKGLEVINKLNPVAYNWKADGKADEGLIAQEVMNIVPNAVTGSEEDYYQMDYSKLVTPLIKAIQEQQEQINVLQSEINNLKGE
nr:unnamed protein product [uncultured Mediterranean phage uvMED]